MQEVCYQNNVISICLEQLEEPNAVLKQWLAICLGRLWRKCDDARWRGVRDSAHEKLYNLLWDEVPDVSEKVGEGRKGGEEKEGEGWEGKRGEGGGRVGREERRRKGRSEGWKSGEGRDVWLIVHCCA